MASPALVVEMQDNEYTNAQVGDAGGLFKSPRSSPVWGSSSLPHPVLQFQSTVPLPVLQFQSTVPYPVLQFRSSNSSSAPVPVYSTSSSAPVSVF